jgi:hypothetical protein
VDELDRHLRDRLRLLTDVERAAASPQGGVAGNGQLHAFYGGIAFDSDGRIVVADTYNHRVQVLV